MSADALLALLRARRSVRSYRDDPVPPELIEQVVEAACWAPSAGNRQDWRFDVVRDDGLKRRLAQQVRDAWRAIAERHSEMGAIDEVSHYASRFDEFERAPVVIAISAARPGLAQEALLGVGALATAGSFASAAMAAQNLMLAAHALGLGTCCMTGALAAEAELAETLGLGRRRQLVCLISLGYAAEEPGAPDRRPLSSVIKECS